MKKEKMMTKKEDMKQDKKMMGKMIKESEKKDVKMDKKMMDKKMKGMNKK